MEFCSCSPALLSEHCTEPVDHFRKSAVFFQVSVSLGSIFG